MTFDRAEKLFFQRVAIELANAGDDPTPANIEAAMRRTLDRDEQIFVELHRFGGKPLRAARDQICRDVYETIRRRNA